MVRLDSRQVRPRLRLRLALQLDPAAVTRLPKPAAHVVRQAPTVEGVHRDFPAKVFQGVAIRLKPAPPRLGLLRKEFRVFEARQAGEEHRLEAPKPPEEPRVLDLRDEANHRAEGVPQNDAPANQFSRLDLSNEVVGHLVPSEAGKGRKRSIGRRREDGASEPRRSCRRVQNPPPDSTQFKPGVVSDSFAYLALGPLGVSPCPRKSGARTRHRPPSLSLSSVAIRRYATPWNPAQCSMRKFCFTHPREGNAAIAGRGEV